MRDQLDRQILDRLEVLDFCFLTELEKGRMVFVNQRNEPFKPPENCFPDIAWSIFNDLLEKDVLFDVEQLSFGGLVVLELQVCYLLLLRSGISGQLVDIEVYLVCCQQMRWVIFKL